MSEEKKEAKAPEMIPISVERNGKKYVFNLEVGAPFEDAKSVLSTLRDYIVRLQVQDEIKKEKEKK